MYILYILSELKDLLSFYCNNNYYFSFNHFLNSCFYLKVTLFKSIDHELGVVVISLLATVFPNVKKNHKAVV